MVKNESLRKLSPLQLIALTLCTLIALVAPRVALAVEYTQYDTAAAGYKAIFDEWQDWCSVDGIAEGKNWKYVVQRVEFIPSEVNIADLGYAFVADNVFGPKTMVVGDTTTSKIYAIYQYLPENKGIAATLTIAKSRLSDEYVAQEKGVYAYTTHSTSSVSTYYVKPSSYVEDVTAYRSLQYTSTDQTKDATLTWKTFKDNKTFETTGLDDYNIAMLRVYNPYSGEHLYTMSTTERDTLVAAGWSDEKIAWWAPSGSSTPVYRLYNQYSGDHHYTTDLAEYEQLGKIGWTKEGVSFFSAPSTDGLPVYRLFNPNVKIGTHHYTTSQEEYNTLGTFGWTKENIALYGVNVAG